MPNPNFFPNYHNRNVLHPSSKMEHYTSHCINKIDCPLNQHCLINNLSYQATMALTDEMQQDKIYYGICETTFQK